jgi:hypothetical protein
MWNNTKRSDTIIKKDYVTEVSSLDFKMYIIQFDIINRLSKHRQEISDTFCQAAWSPTYIPYMKIWKCGCIHLYTCSLIAQEGINRFAQEKASLFFDTGRKYRSQNSRKLSWVRAPIRRVPVAWKLRMIEARRQDRSFWRENYRKNIKIPTKCLRFDSEWKCFLYLGN